MKLKVKRLVPDAVLPVKAHPTDSGFDLFAAERVVIEPGETKIVKTGIAIELPNGHDAQVRPRSGVTSKTKLRVQVGTIDQGYAGEIGIMVDNISNAEVRNEWRYPKLGIDGKTIKDNYSASSCTYLIRKGDKLAQLVIAAVAHPTVVEVDVLNEGERGGNGFGSTGI